MPGSLRRSGPRFRCPSCPPVTLSWPSLPASACSRSVLVLARRSRPPRRRPASLPTVPNPARLAGSVPLAPEAAAAARGPLARPARRADRSRGARRAVSLRRQLAERVRLLRPRRLRLRQARRPAPAQRRGAVRVRSPGRPPATSGPATSSSSTGSATSASTSAAAGSSTPRSPASGSRSRASPRAAAASRAPGASSAPDRLAPSERRVDPLLVVEDVSEGRARLARARPCGPPRARRGGRGAAAPPPACRRAPARCERARSRDPRRRRRRRGQREACPSAISSIVHSGRCSVSLLSCMPRSCRPATAAPSDRTRIPVREGTDPPRGSATAA